MKKYQLKSNRRDRSAGNGSFFTSSVAGAVALLSSLVFLVIAPGFFTPHSAFADSINMTVSSSIALDVLPSNPSGTESSSDTTASNISISTDNTAGYTLSLSGSSSSAPALSGASGSIPSINAEKSAISNFTSGTWGYKPTKKNGSSWDNLTVISGATTYTAGYFLPAPTLTGDTLDVTDTANSTPNEYNLAVATKVGNETAIGSYSGAFVVTAVTNFSGITVTYDPQGGNYSGSTANNEMVYSEPEISPAQQVTKTTSNTNQTTASGTWKSSVSDSMNYVSNANYYQDLSFTDAGTKNVTIYYSTESTSYDWICVFNGTSYTPTSSDGCSSALTPATNTGTASGNKLGGGKKSNNYSYTAKYSFTGNTARIYFRSDSSSNYYGFWAEVTGIDQTIVQNLTSGTYLEPTKTDLKFVGWCDGEVSGQNSNPTCSGTTYTADTVPGVNSVVYNNVTLKAMWLDVMTFDRAFAAAGKTKSGDYYKMQDMSAAICSAVSIGEIGSLVDTRSGNEVYYVGKLNDGKCWMLDNLRLGDSSNTITLTSSDTNIASDPGTYTLPASGTANFDSTNGYTNAAINTASKNNTTTSYGSGSGKIGTYYNYCAASAGTYCYASGSGTGDAQYDVCPKGWRMPTGGSSGEYNALYTAYSSNQANFKAALSTPLSGYFYDGSASSQGSSGSFWSSTYSSGNGMYRLYVDSSSVYPSGSSYRYFGSSVRCVAQ